MKKSTEILSLFSAAIFGITACQQALNHEGQQPSAKTHTVTITAGMPQTKTVACIGEDNVVKYEWTAEDTEAGKFHIYENGVEAQTVSAVLNEGLMSISATFAGEAVGEAEYSGYFNSGVQSRQKTFSEGYDQDSDVLVAQVTSGNVSEGIKFPFKRETAFAKITLKGLTAGVSVGKVTVEALDGTTVLAADYDRTGGFSANAVSKIELEGPVAIYGQEAVVWLASLPFENVNLRITVETVDGEGNAAVFQKELSKAVSLERNNVTGLTVALEPEVPVTIPEKIYLLGSGVDVNGMKTNWDPKNPAEVEVVDGEATLVITTTKNESLNVYTATPQECTAAGDDAMWGLVNETSIVPLSMDSSMFGKIQGLKNKCYLEIPYAGTWTIKYTEGITKATVTYVSLYAPEVTPEKIYMLGNSVVVNGNVVPNWDPQAPSAIFDVVDGEAMLVIRYEGKDPVDLNVYIATPEQIEAANNDGKLWDAVATTSIVPLSMESSEWGKVQRLKNKCFLTIPYAGIWTIKYTEGITKATVTYESLYAPEVIPAKIYLLGSDVDVNGKKTNWDPKNPTAVVDVVDGEATLVITTTKNELLNVYTATPEQIEAADKDDTLWNNEVGPIGTTSVVPLSMDSSMFGKIQGLKNKCYLEIPYAGIWTIKYTDGISLATVMYKSSAGE